MVAGGGIVVATEVWYVIDFPLLKLYTPVRKEQLGPMR